MDAGFALACQTVIEGDAAILVPEQEKIERRLVTDKTARKVAAPFAYDYTRDQSVRAFFVTLDPPTLDDATDDCGPARARARAARYPRPGSAAVAAANTRRAAARIAADEMRLAGHRDRRNGHLAQARRAAAPDRRAGRATRQPHPLWGLAIDIGTTTVTVYLVDLLTGEAVDSAAEYNGRSRAARM